MSTQSSDLFLSADQQDLLMAALNSNQPNNSGARSQRSDSKSMNFTPGSGALDFSDDSPYLDFDPDGDFDDSFDLDPNARMIGDIPGELHDKRKSLDEKDDDEEGGGKRREGEDKLAKKPGRKPLTSEPTSKRKAQNRAAQRAFRERKEKHLKDLETKVEDLEKASESANHENGLLRAQVERLQVELKEYRKRLSWVSANGIGRSPTAPYGNQARNNSVNNQNDFQFEFPKFGDLPAMSATNLFNSPGSQGSPNINPARSATLPNANSKNTQSGPARQSFSGSTSQAQQRQSSTSQSPISTSYSASPQPQTQSKRPQDSVDSLTGLFSPSILEASRHAALGGYFPQNNFNNANRGARASMDNNTSNNAIGVYTNSTSSNSDSPGSSSESHNAVSSIGTSPEPSLSSPGNKLTEYGLNTINEENQVSNFEGKDYLCEQLQKACGCADDPIPPIMSQSNKNPPGNTNTSSGFDPNSFNWLAQQNSNGFDPILFGDYRETQDNILSQDFGSFFNDAYPLPDLGSPLHNYNDLASDAAPKPDVLQQAEAAQEGVEEVVPDNDKPMTCNKIWDRLQSMEKFRNGEIDIDNLCSELRAKAKCSEGGAVVDKKDVDKILGMAK